MASNDGGDDDERSSPTSSLAELNEIIDGDGGRSGYEDIGIEDDNGDDDEGGNGRSGLDCHNVCSQCNKKYVDPRVLSCLHVFCEECLNRILLEKSEAVEFDPASMVDCTTSLLCPECQQETKILKHCASSLPLDYVRCAAVSAATSKTSTVASDVSNQSEIVCTSCKTKKKAVARCNDCASFLCPSCVSAHQYMRCFENHKVMDFQDMTDDPHSLFHKPVSCHSHPDEALKYFCLNCQFPVCDECIMTEHKGSDHHFEVMMTVEHKQREELLNLMAESKSKLQYCEEAVCTLEGQLSELQMQNDNAKSHIEETFQTYKAFLDKVKEEKLKELDNLHTTQELNVMDTYHNVETTKDKIEDACTFTTRLLKDGGVAEILLLKSIVRSQLLYLINNTPKPDVTVCLEFETNEAKYEDAVMASFGDFKKPDGMKDRNAKRLSSLHSSFESEAFRLPTGVLGAGSEGSAGVGSSSTPSSTVGLATPTAFPDFTLSQLASIADMSQSPSSPLSLADIISSDSLVSSNINALNNLTALAKLGSATLNNQGQLLMNGHVVSGFGLDGSIPPHPPSSTSSPNPLGNTFDSATFGALLNGGLQSPRGMSSRGGSPHMDFNGGSVNGALSSAMANSLIIGNNGEVIQLNSSGFTSPRTSNAKLIPVRIRFKFGQLGPGKGQFSSPHGFCLGAEEEIVVADTNNHRIQIFDKCGEFKSQFGIPGKEEGQLWYPRKVAVMRNSGKFVVCDRGNERSRMQIFSKIGHFIKKIAIRYIDIVAGLAITHQGHIVAVDSVSPTVFVISEGGDLLCWFDCSDYMREPSDIAISGKEYYVCDFKGHCVVVFNEDGQFLRRIGCENITNYPNGIDISDAGDVLVGDSHGNRFHVAVFSRDGSLLSEYECPYVKVSRCCGLKITTEGFIVTLAKNNHHVLILNMLYIM